MAEENNQESNRNQGGFTQGNALALGTAVSGAGSLVGGIVGAAAQADLMQRAQRSLNEANQELDKLKSSQPSLATPSEYYKQVQQAYDQRLIQHRLEDINRSV